MAWISTSWFEIIALVTNCYNNAVESYNNAAAALASANAASASATTAAATANAAMWISGHAYAQGECAISPVDFSTYRRTSAGSGVIDPSSDLDNWSNVVASVIAQTVSGKNKLLNTNFENPVNQLGKASRVTTAGAYNFDCWYYGADGKFYQAADYLNLSASQQYTLNWEGSATAEYLIATTRSSGIEGQGGWTAIAKGAQLTTPADVISGAKFVWIRWSGVTSDLATFDKPQLEEGPIATTHERKLFSQDLDESMDYYEHSSDYGSPPSNNNYAGMLRLTCSPQTLADIGGFQFKKRKRFTPSVAIYNPITGASGSVYRISDAASASVISIAYVGHNGVGNVTINAGNDNGYFAHFVALARI